MDYETKTMEAIVNFENADFEDELTYKGKQRIFTDEAIKNFFDKLDLQFLLKYKKLKRNMREFIFDKIIILMKKEYEKEMGNNKTKNDEKAYKYYFNPNYKFPHNLINFFHFQKAEEDELCNYIHILKENNTILHSGMAWRVFREISTKQSFTPKVIKYLLDNNLTTDRGEYITYYGIEEWAFLVHQSKQCEDFALKDPVFSKLYYSENKTFDYWKCDVLRYTKLSKNAVKEALERFKDCGWIYKVLSKNKRTEFDDESATKIQIGLSKSLLNDQLNKKIYSCISNF